jgi:hypothetical protein
MSQAQIGNLQVALGINTAQFAAGLSQAQGSLASFGKGLKAFAAAAGAALSLGALGMAVKSNIDRMDELGKAAQKIGIPVEELSKLEYAARLSDVSLDTLSGTMSKFSRSIAEVAGGGKNDAGLALQAIGVSATDAQGKLLPTTEIVANIAEEFSVMRDGAGKTALAIALFGKSGAELIPLLNGGREAIASAGQELQQFGGVVTPEATARAQEFNDNITRLQTAFNGLLQEAVAPILPELIKLTQYFIDLAKTGAPVKEWVENTIAFFAELKPFIESTRKEIELLTEGLRYLGLVAEAPIEININGGKEAQGPPPPKQIKDAPFLPQSAKQASSIVPKIPKDTIDSIYGAGEAFDAMWKHMEAGIPQAETLNNVFLDMAETISDSLGNALQGLISGSMSLKDAFASMAQGISQQLSQLAAQLLKSSIIKVIQMMLGMGGGAGLNFGGMTFGGLYADGGNLGSGKWGIAGENGPEIIHGPASVTPMSKAGAQAPQMNVTVINNSSANVSTRQGANGGLEVMVEEMIADKLLRGGNKIDSALARGYGLRRAGR